MSLQHADQYVTTLYDFTRTDYTTMDSNYAHRYLRFLRGELKTEPRTPGVGGRSPNRAQYEQRWAQIRTRLREEWER